MVPRGGWLETRRVAGNAAGGCAALEELHAALRARTLRTWSAFWEPAVRSGNLAGDLGTHTPLASSVHATGGANAAKKLLHKAWNSCSELWVVCLTALEELHAALCLA